MVTIEKGEIYSREELEESVFKDKIIIIELNADRNFISADKTHKLKVVEIYDNVSETKYSITKKENSDIEVFVPEHIFREKAIVVTKCNSCD